MNHPAAQVRNVYFRYEAKYIIFGVSSNICDSCGYDYTMLVFGT